MVVIGGLVCICGEAAVILKALVGNIVLSVFTCICGLVVSRSIIANIVVSAVRRSLFKSPVAVLVSFLLKLNTVAGRFGSKELAFCIGKCNNAVTDMNGDRCDRINQIGVLIGLNDGKIFSGCGCGNALKLLSVCGKGQDLVARL